VSLKHNAHNSREVSVSTVALRGVAAWALLLCALSTPAALAQHRHAEEHRAPEPRAALEAQSPQAPATGEPGVIKIGGGRLEIPDVEVLNQDGRKVRFYSDLIKGRVVVLSFFFTSCTFVCPAQGRALAKLQARLAGRLGKEVFIVSITKDPKTDTASNLKQWGEEFGVGPGWTLVTGEEGVMTKLLWDFSRERPGPSMHSPIVFIGNDRTGIWTDAGGLSAPERLVEIIDRVAGPVASSER
jgi:cytochrome oxidase Cu insertion factor (SCO1/SenC/PrrC family)